MKQVIFVLLTLAVLNGCASKPTISPAMQADLDKPIYCKGFSECKTMWKRALQFVSLNAEYEIKTANAALIETKQWCDVWCGNFKTSALSMRVTKSPLGDRRHQLRVEVWCRTMWGCVPDTAETLWRAQLFIREGKG